MSLNQSEAPEGSFDNLIQVSRDLNIVADGPLSRMFASVLNALYKKEVDPETGIAIESQALDVQTGENLWIASKVAKPDEHIGMLYGVYNHQASLCDVIAVAEALQEMTPEEKAKSALICVTHERDAQTGATFQNFHYADAIAKKCSALYAHDNDFSVRHYRANNVFARSLKALAAGEGVKFYSSLEAYVADNPPQE